MFIRVAYLLFVFLAHRHRFRQRFFCRNHADNNANLRRKMRYQYHYHQVYATARRYD